MRRFLAQLPILYIERIEQDNIVHDEFTEDVCSIIMYDFLINIWWILFTGDDNTH